MPSKTVNVKDQVREFTISLSTVLKFVFLFFCCYVVLKIWNFLIILSLAVILAVTLNSPLNYLVVRGLNRKVALAVISVCTISLVIVLLFFLIPPVFSELGGLSNSIPTLKEEILQNTPAKFGMRVAVQQILSAPLDTTKLLDMILSFGQYAVYGAGQFLLLIIFSLYLLADGPRSYRWLIAYFNRKNQEKISLTCKEVSEVAGAYVSGQLLTSIMASLFSFIILSYYNVPATLSLSVLAGIFDALPIAGFFLFAIPASLLALTVSLNASIFVITGYTIYHLVESYIIIPKVYGTRLRLSALVILIGIYIAYAVSGILGAIAILPLLACYPIIERIWFAKHVGQAVIEEHSPEPVDGVEVLASEINL